ncbi:short-subunit dehydrogenase [Bradyrhizobium sp. LM2.7]
MDLGIKGRRAIVCASSKGLGRACAISLADAGVHVTLTARGAEALKKTADDIRKAYPNVTVTEIVGDITMPAGREAVLKACPEPDILINNAGGPPPGDFRNWTRDDWIKAIDANMLTPIELIKATVDGMMARKFGRIVNITSAAVKAPIDILGLSNGARAGLTGFHRRPFAQDRDQQRHHQRPVARPVRDRPPDRNREGRSRQARCHAGADPD